MTTFDAATGRGAKGDRGREFSATAVAQFGDFVDNLVVCREDVVGKLNLSDRPQAVQSHAHGDGGNAAFGQRCIEDPVGAVFLLQAVGDAEDSTEIADILTKDEYIRVALQLQVNGAVKRLNHIHIRHVTTYLPNSSRCS